MNVRNANVKARAFLTLAIGKSQATSKKFEFRS